MVAKAGESELSTISTGFLSLSFSINISKQSTKPSESQGEDKFLGSSSWRIWVVREGGNMQGKGCAALEPSTESTRHGLNSFLSEKIQSFILIGSFV